MLSDLMYDGRMATCLTRQGRDLGKHVLPPDSGPILSAPRVHASFVETDMTECIGAPKISPESVARQVFDAVEAGQVEVLADERTRSVKASLPRDHEVIYPPLQASWDAAMKARADTGCC